MQTHKRNISLPRAPRGKSIGKRSTFEKTYLPKISFSSDLSTNDSDKGPQNQKDKAVPPKMVMLDIQRVSNKHLLDIDAQDLADERQFGQHKKRQFAPEYAQSCYKTLLSQQAGSIPETSIYWKLKNRVSNRAEIIQMVSELVSLKQYTEETFFTACNLADRYVIALADIMEQPSSLVSVAITVVLIAAKMCQPVSPSFNRMLRLVKDEWNVEIEKEEILEIEESLLRVLDWNLVTPSPLPFLERYQRLFGLQVGGKSVTNKYIDVLAKTLLRQFLVTEEYIMY